MRGSSAQRRRLGTIEGQVSPIGHDGWEAIVRMIDWLCEHWREKDEGIWEVRSGRQEFLENLINEFI